MLGQTPELEAAGGPEGLEHITSLCQPYLSHLEKEENLSPCAVGVILIRLSLGAYRAHPPSEAGWVKGRLVWKLLSDRSDKALLPQLCAPRDGSVLIALGPEAQWSFDARRCPLLGSHSAHLAKRLPLLAFPLSFLCVPRADLECLEPSQDWAAMLGRAGDLMQQIEGAATEAPLSPCWGPWGWHDLPLTSPPRGPFHSRDCGAWPCSV